MARGGEWSRRAALLVLTSSVAVGGDKSYLLHRIIAAATINNPTAITQSHRLGSSCVNLARSRLVATSSLRTDEAN